MGLLRTFLAIIVVISHTESFFNLEFLGGKIAVQSFYIISGFYMSLILNEKYIDANNSYKLFITNRLMRLYPIYWVVLILVIISSIFFGILTKGDSYGALNVFIDNYETLNLISLLMVIFSNIFILFQDTLLLFEINLTSGMFYFEPSFEQNALNGFDFALIYPAWTIALELLFYSIAPFIVKRKTLIVLLVLTLLIGLNYYLKTHLGLNHTPWNYMFFPTELPFFLIGTLSYKIYKSEIIKKLNKKFHFAVYILPILYILFYDRLIFEFKDKFFFFLLFLSIPFIFELSKKSKIDRYIGDLSYPIYLIHALIITFVYKLNHVIISKGITVIIISIITSMILKFLISDRIENYRQNRLTK